MRVISIKKLKVFYENPLYKDSKTSIIAWHKIVKTANWINSNELKKQFTNASIIGENRIIFNIKGNKYRLIVSINYDFQTVFIRFIVTHVEYDKINAKEI
jgi:mRNA interferase HigB